MRYDRLVEIDDRLGATASTDETTRIAAEALANAPDSGTPVPFQELSRRITREHDIDRLAREVPVRVHLFDCLLCDEDVLLDRPLRERLKRIDASVTLGDRIDRAESLRTDDAERATAFYESALTAGHEGIVVKNLDATSQPGTCVGTMLKVKPTMEPLDLVVPRAKYSEGR